MFKKYYLVTYFINGAIANSCIDTSVTRFVIEANKKNRVVVTNTWRISKADYNEFKKFKEIR